MSDELTLKWGALKGWRIESDAAIAAADKLFATPRSMSVMMQRDTPEEKKLLCDLIDAVDCELIYLDWDGKYVTKDEAKKYVMDYER